MARPVTTKERAKIREWRAEGRSTRWIAQRLRRTTDTIRRHASDETEARLQRRERLRRLKINSTPDLLERKIKSQRANVARFRKQVKDQKLKKIAYLIHEYTGVPPEELTSCAEGVVALAKDLQLLRSNAI